MSVAGVREMSPNQSNFSVCANHISSGTSRYIHSPSEHGIAPVRTRKETKNTRSDHLQGGLSGFESSQRSSMPKLCKSRDDYLLSNTEKPSFLSFNAYVNMDPSDIGIQEFLYRLALLKDTYELKFEREPCLLTPTRALFSTGLEAIFAIQEGARVFRPENVTLPSSNFQPGLTMLHERLEHLNFEVHERILELLGKRKTLLAGDFIRWVYEQYNVQGTRMQLRKCLFWRNTDIHVSERVITSAISKYASVDFRTDRTPTGIMAEIIVEKLQQYRHDHRANRKPVRETMRLWVRKRISSSKTSHASLAPVLRSPESNDRLVVKFPDAFILAE